jgi:predicted helicase
MTSELKMEIFDISMKSYTQGQIDGYLSCIEAFKKTSEFSGKTVFTITEIVDFLLRAKEFVEKQ